MELEVGSRVTYGSAGKTGTARYIGEVNSLSGEWVGIELDKPEGKHNGELNGKIYFTCPPDHGVFVKKTQVRVLGGPSRISGSSPTMRNSSTRSSMAVGTSANSSASRLQQVRDRRSSAIGTTSGSSIRPPTADTSIGTPNLSRLSLDPTARHPSLSGSRQSNLASTISSDELNGARARIEQLEEALHQRTCEVEQLQEKLLERRDATATPMDIDESNEKPTSSEDSSALWLGKIEAIRTEAEEHVRVVRLELEDRITDLQSLNEALRTDNSEQASRIKTFEIEIGQYKSRIAHFATVEQKKAEEIALAVAKTSSGVRKVEALESQIIELQDIIETMTLEKETLEMDKEIAEENAEELLAEIDRLKTSLALAQEATSLPIGNISGDIADENQKLRLAIKTLHDRSAEEKNELSKKLRQLQRENTELVALREEVEVVTKKKKNLESEVEELKELLDVANAYESMVEDLTEKNLTLGEKVADLEASISSLESLKEMSEEMEHQHNEYEAELNRELDSQRTTIHELKHLLADFKATVEDKDRTITRFRDATNRSREELNQLKNQLRVEAGELESLKGTTHSALSQTMSLRALAATAREYEAEAARHKINAEQAGLENAFLRAAIPDSIFSELDQSVLRVRLRLGRISGKADILVRILRKEMETVLMQQDDSTDLSLEGSVTLDYERRIQQLLMGAKLVMLSCQAKEDLFILECHLTTIEDYQEVCSRLDTPTTFALEEGLDGALRGVADGTLFDSRSASEASIYTRLLHSIDDWKLSRPSDETGAPLPCAVVKIRSKKNTQSLEFSFALMWTFIKALKGFLLNPETMLNPLDAKSGLTLIFDKVAEELCVLLKLCQHLQRRADMDLCSSLDDLDGSIAAGGDVVELLTAYTAECETVWAVMQDQLSTSRLQNENADVLTHFTEQSLHVMLLSLKERLTTLFKSICRGAFTDAVTSRTFGDNLHEGRSQWQIRAQELYQELVNAGGVRANLIEMSEVCQELKLKIRDLERSESQHRVVTQKLESDVLRLSDALAQSTTDCSKLNEQLARERDQFNVALDESHKEKAILDNSNRELRKQLKRATEMGVSMSSNTTGARGKSTLNQADAEAFREAFRHLHSELHRVRVTLAKERLDRLAPVPQSKRTLPSQNLHKCFSDLSNFARTVKAQLSMPRIVDLTLSSASARDQLVAKQLEHAKMRKKLDKLRTSISTTMEANGWSRDITNAIDRGDNVFGWRPPEMERPPVLLGRVIMHSLNTSKLTGDDVEMEDVSSISRPIPLVLNCSQVRQLSQTLVC